jgi:alpha/beta superfamily hydrolase
MNIKLSSIGHLWDDVCNLVIRPQRCQYDPSVHLGPRLFTLGNNIYERTDFTVVNGRGHNLQCSHYQPVDTQRPAAKLPCVIYCHGNCGSRCDALDAVQILLPCNITVLAFDFSGSGLSDGEYVSLGFYEKQDVSCIVEYLWGTKRVSRIGLWGRSMGAATSIMYCNLDHTIAGIVVDSPFTSLEDVMTELVTSYQSWIPKKMIKMGINVMRRSILSRAHFDIRNNAPIEYAKNCFVPALFAHAEGDDFIKIHHSERLYEVYGGDKNLIRFDGDHNSERPDFFYDSVAIFFYNVLVSNDPVLEKELQTSYSSDMSSTGSSQPIASKIGVGISTPNSKNIVRSDSDEEQERGDDRVERAESTHDLFSILRSSRKDSDLPKKISRLIDDDIGELPKSPHTNQMVIPSSLSSDTKRTINVDVPTNEKLEQQYLYQALIESLKDQISNTSDDKELKELNARLEELIIQAKNEEIEI